MAGVFVNTKPYSEVDYALDGRIREVTIRGVKIYDETDGTAVDGWMEQLATFVAEIGLDVDDGLGLHAFVYRMQDDGHLPKTEH